MPIYSYRCEDCQHAQDVLRKISDPPLVDCPACGAPAFRKQVTAAGFQLKGSGWYVTDFRNPQAGKGGAKGKNGKETEAPDPVSGTDKPLPTADPGAKDKSSSPATSDAAPASAAKGASRSPAAISTPPTTASN